MTERELQIQKIHQLLRSNDKAMVNLAFQLIESHFSFEEVFNQQCPITKIDYDTRLIFEGYTKPDFSKFMVDYLEQLIDIKNLPMKFKRRCLNICIEFYQNIVRYTGIKPKSEKIYLEILFGEKCSLICDELIKRSQIEESVRAISYLNSSSLNDLKHVYKSILKKGRLSALTQNHISLKWIDLRRKSKNSLEYEIQSYDEEHVVLKLAVTLDYQ